MKFPLKRKHNKTNHDDAARMLRISGEIVTVDEAVNRSGIARAKLLQRYREGRRTWEALQNMR